MEVGGWRAHFFGDGGWRFRPPALPPAFIASSFNLLPSPRLPHRLTCANHFHHKLRRENRQFLLLRFEPVKSNISTSASYDYQISLQQGLFPTSQYNHITSKQADLMRY